MTARATRLLLSAVAAIVGALMLAPLGASQDDAGVAYSIELTGTIDPATQQWLGQALDDAADEGAEVAIIRIDTPGGLDSSTREMVQDIIDAPMPVIVYVSPDGARAASAGLFITESGDVAAMAPQTNIGSATPISIGPGETNEVLGRKIENDAAAYVRALAEAHGRNGDLASEMVTDAVNRTAEEAERAGLIDVIASSERELLDELDGFRVQGPKEGRLDTEGLVIETHDMPLQYQLLQIIVNPTIAYLLLLAGLVGLAVELFSGGSTIVPGVFGAISLILGLYGTAQLPVTLVGIVLLLLGVAFIIAEAHLPTQGILGGAGVAALVVSGLVLYNTDSDSFEVSVPVVVVVGLLLGGFIAFAVQRAVLARGRPVMTGSEELVGAIGEVRQPLDPVGQVFVEGALWRAQAAEGGSSVDRGYRVRVESVDGLTLAVRPLSPEEEEEAADAGRTADTEQKAQEGAAQWES
jgi:membrane-bound serine protease (ClpP class)